MSYFRNTYVSRTTYSIKHRAIRISIHLTMSQNPVQFSGDSSPHFRQLRQHFSKEAASAADIILPPRLDYLRLASQLSLPN